MRVRTSRYSVTLKAQKQRTARRALCGLVTTLAALTLMSCAQQQPKPTPGVECIPVPLVSQAHRRQIPLLSANDDIVEHTLTLYGIIDDLNADLESMAHTIEIAPRWQCHPK